MYFVWISEQTAAFALYCINWLVCITVVESVYSAVRIGSLYNTYDSSLKGSISSIQTLKAHTYKNVHVEIHILTYFLER